MPVPSRKVPVRVVYPRTGALHTHRYPHQPPQRDDRSRSRAWRSNRPARKLSPAPVSAWALILVLLSTGAGVALGPVPLYDGGPEPWELGNLLPEGPGLYRLALCAGDVRAYPFGNGSFQLTEPLSLDPLVGRIELVDGGGALQVTAVLPGQTVLSFAILTLARELNGSEPLTLRIHLQVGFCGDEAASLDPEIADYLNGSLQARHPAAGYLLDTEQANRYQLIACQGERYSYLFHGPTQVRNGASDDPTVASLVLYNPPGRLMVYATGTGTATLTLQADALEFPLNEVDWVDITVELTVVYCGQAPPEVGSGALNQQGTIILDSDSGESGDTGQGSSGQESGADGTDGGSGGAQAGATSGASGAGYQTTSITVSGSGSGSVAVSQSLGVTGTGISGDQDESLGTTSDDGTSFAAHVEMNPGDTSSIFIGLKNEGANDIAYTLWLDNAKGVTVSATAGGTITNLIQTCTYCFKFVLPGGAGGAGTGITLNIAIPDDAGTGFYSVGQIKIKAMNV